jgi:transglutaminase-like putative cysteine protease
MNAVSLGLAVAVLGIAVYSIEQTQWINPNPQLMLIYGIGILAGLVIAKIRLSLSVVIIVGLIGGCLVTLLHTLSLFSNFQLTNSELMITQLNFLWSLISTGEAADSTVPFAIFLIFSVWIMAYISIRFLISKQNPWVAVLLGTIAILINMSNTSAHRYLYFIIFFPTTALLIAQVHLIKHFQRTENSNHIYTRRMIIYFAAGVLLVSVLVMNIAWVMPVNHSNYLQRQASIVNFQQNIIDNASINIFSSVPGKWKILASDNYEALAFGKPDLGYDVLFQVKSTSHPLYFRTRSYDIYESWGWTNSPTKQNQIPSNVTFESLPDSEYRQEITYEVINKSKTDMLLTAGEFLSVDIPVILHVLEDGNDIVTVSTSYTMKPDAYYHMTASISTATISHLGEAGENYPRYIRTYNLQLPNRLPSQVRSLSRMITRNQDSPYNKVKAIFQYLSEFKYIQEGTSPPADVDGVYDFLFNTKEGNCTNFASAMVILLRCADVPARISSGYILQQPDASKGTYNIRPMDFHARPEVYFPGYGWIEFEATPVPEFNLDPFIQMPSIVPTDIELTDDDAYLVDTSSDAAFYSQEKEFSILPAIGDLWNWINQGLDSSPLGTSLTIFLLIMCLVIVSAFFALLWMINWLRKIAKADDPAYIYAKICFFGSLLRLRPLSYQTPLEYKNVLISAFPNQAEAINHLVWNYLSSTYSSQTTMEQSRRILIRDSWKTVLHTFIGRLLYDRFAFFKRLIKKTNRYD